MEAIILAGGLGTRLRGVIGEETPKCMAPVAGCPFLYFLLRYAQQQGITRIVLSLGYKSDVVLQWLAEMSWPMQIDFVVEDEPLGTGGGIRKALDICHADDVFVLNGDTFFDVPLSEFRAHHQSCHAELSLALKRLQDFDRYGTVVADAQGCVTGFREKAACKEGLINGGVYCLHRSTFLQRNWPLKFSFEKDYLEAFVADGKFHAFESAGYFIDIGVPADYSRAQHDFQRLFSPA